MTTLQRFIKREIAVRPAISCKFYQFHWSRTKRFWFLMTAFGTTKVSKEAVFFVSTDNKKGSEWQLTAFRYLIS